MNLFWKLRDNLLLRLAKCVGALPTLALHLKIGSLNKKAGGRASSRAATIGQWGEEQAARFLEKHGFRIIERRARPSRRGELDLIATRDNALVFVEVKTRANEKFGSPISSVGRAKRHALNRAAIRWLRRARWPKLVCRFDVVEVVGAPSSKNPPIIRHTENAFPFEEAWRMR